MNGAFLSNVLLVMAMWIMLWTTWLTTRPERPPANAPRWQIESFAGTNRHFHIVMAIHISGFLFVLTMLVLSYNRG